ncbi:AAA family ATPase [Mycobacterium cookii]|uniref:LuxR family transcriptional regulator n=1 Tax=Mycobacterium cookii TaxID=1775 RepID=A0A7I7L360_9MYCO|nr:LuxR family transcriptional regulator [Mycobacterium cookii]MCV7328905.1 AAA family ATPase [Mycobacterium cookii]BBX48429.1 LuxR family transcriptional regulator [Mycobacterium cookii]
MPGNLLEREAPLAQLKLSTRRMARGGGEVVLLRGEAGIGKTTVLANFVKQLGPELRVLQGWCDPLGAPRPLGPLTDALPGLDVAAAAGLTAAVESGDTAQIYRQLLCALGDRARWVWVIEDAHWADGATLDMVRFLARRIGALRLLLVISFRDDELSPAHPLAVTLGDLANCAAVTRIGLSPLSLSAVAALAAGTGVNAEQLHEVTGGNPFFVSEVLAAGPVALTRKGLPRSISEAVCGRLARLSAKARETAHAVAVCGPRADIALLDKMCPEARTALYECLGAGVLNAEGELVAFRHELARRATLAQIPDFDRTELHRRALTVLAQPPIDPNTLAALAFHADQAGERDATVRHGIAAADRSAALGANREAAKLYALALRHADAVADEQRVVWLERYAFACYLSGQAEPAVTALRDAIALRRNLGHRLEEGDDLRWLSRLLQPLGRAGEAIDAAHASLGLLQDLGPSPQLAWSLLNMAHISALALDPVCARYAASAVTLGVELADPAIGIRARGYLALTAVFSSGTGWDELGAVWREALSTPGYEEHAAVLGVLICWYTVLRGELDRAETYLAEASQFCDDRDLGMFSALLTAAATLAQLHRGEWDRAAVTAEQIVTRPELSPQHRILPLVTLALIDARRGRQSVVALPSDVDSGAQPGDLVHLGAVSAARAEIAWLSGDDETALAEAHAGLAAAHEHADRWQVDQLRRWIRLAGGTCEATDGDAGTPFESEIRGDWQSAADEWVRRGCPYDAALAQLGGDAAAVTTALAAFRRLGAKAAARRAQQRLAALRERAPRARRADTLSDPHALTGRQRQVFDLLVAGRSNREIAAELHISPKTVGHHVEAILAKLGAENRTHAVAYALQHQAALQTES